MNCPSRVDPEALPNGWNQNPDHFAAEVNRDTGSIADKAKRHDHDVNSIADRQSLGQQPDDVRNLGVDEKQEVKFGEADVRRVDTEAEQVDQSNGGGGLGSSGRGTKDLSVNGAMKEAWRVLKTYGKFVGPGWMVSVAYIDPGNYATDVAAGASNRYRLLVIVLTSNIIAIFLQSLTVKLGSVTGLNLAENCRKHFPLWLSTLLFLFAEAAIIATDMAEVIGFAIALNLLGNVPLVAGCAISIVDVLVILLLYRPGGSMRGVRLFECMVALLVLGVVICFAIELSLINVSSVGDIFRGYLPSHVLIEKDGLLQACGILGATVMPHSLYLGSGLVQSRLYDYDQKHDNVSRASSTSELNDNGEKYRPSLAAIRYCLKYSIADLTISLFTFALFVNSAILIVAGASLYNNADALDATLFGIYDLLTNTIGKPAAIIFALALLLSGVSAGIVCTIAGQMVWMGQVQLPVKPWVQRLVTRSIAITPSILIAGCVGKQGISTALEASQIALSAILPFVSAPLIWFTCRSSYMTVPVIDGQHGARAVNMRNNWLTAAFAIVMWLLIVVMNVASWVLQAL